MLINLIIPSINVFAGVTDGDVNTKFEIEKNKIEEKDNPNISNDKVVEENKTNNPSTGDNIVIYIGLFIIKKIND